MQTLPETHQRGVLFIENLESIQAMDKSNCDVGLQVSHDGRIWLCVNGIAFIRFRPPFKKSDRHNLNASRKAYEEFCQETGNPNDSVE